MAREILFRAKRIVNGSWVEGHLLKSFTGICFIAKSFDNILNVLEAYEVDKDTICQYTGLTDKNGNKIWENDVLRDTDDEIIMVVRWDDEELRFVLDDYGYNGCFMEYGWDELAGEFEVVDTYGFDDFCSPINKVCEVIGNIFDNRELFDR